MTESELNKAVLDARKVWQDAANIQPAPVLAELSNKVNFLMNELSALLSSGAKFCPNCGNHPHGMQKRPGVYEVGCLKCASPKKPTYRAQGETPAQAAENWNNEQYVSS